MERKIKTRGPESRSIDISDDYALDYWAKELNVTQARLKNAVLVVGTAAIDVKRVLKK